MRDLSSGSSQRLLEHKGDLPVEEWIDKLVSPLTTSYFIQSRIGSLSGGLSPVLDSRAIATRKPLDYFYPDKQKKDTSRVPCSQPPRYKHTEFLAEPIKKSTTFKVTWQYSALALLFYSTRQ